MKRKKIFRILCLISSVQVLMSCQTPSYLAMVLDVKPVNPSSAQNETSAQSDQLVFEDENCKVQYYLWGVGGISTFRFTNKTDKAIVLDLSRSFVTSEGVSKDVYQARTWKTDLVSWTEQPKSVVAPKMTKEITGRSIFKVDPLWERDSKGSYVFGRNANYTYTMEGSPIKFSNSILYYFEDAPQNEKLLTHDFYVSACNTYAITFYLGEVVSDSSLKEKIKNEVSDGDTNTRYYWVRRTY